MKSLMAAATLVLATLVAQAVAEDVPCENMLEELRAAIDSTTLSDTDASTVKQLEDKGIERCNADDDARADEFFAQALKILGK